jgi:hypothetical protein
MNASHRHAAHVINLLTAVTYLVPMPAAVTTVSGAMASFPVKVGKPSDLTASLFWEEKLGNLFYCHLFLSVIFVKLFGTFLMCLIIENI